MKIKLNIVLTFAAIIMFLLGLGLTVATSTMLGSFGHDVNTGSIHFARAAGAAMLGLGTMTWLARNAGPSRARNAFLVGLSVVFLLEAIVDTRAIMAGYSGPDAWLTGVAPWLIFFLLTVLAGRSAMADEVSH